MGSVEKRNSNSSNRTFVKSYQHHLYLKLKLFSLWFLKNHLISLAGLTSLSPPALFSSSWILCLHSRWAPPWFAFLLGISSWLCGARVYVQPPVWLSAHLPISLSLSEWVTRFRIYLCHCPQAFFTVYGLVWFCFGEERVSGSTSTSLLSSSHFIRIPTYGRQGSDRKIQATVYTPRIKGFMKE